MLLRLSASVSASAGIEREPAKVDRDGGGRGNRLVDKTLVPSVLIEATLLRSIVAERPVLLVARF